MSLTGLFLVLFLVVHLAGNLQLLIDDKGETFNAYAYMMANNPLIKVIAIGNYVFIALHTVQGILLAIKNRQAKGSKYAVSTNKTASWASKNMALLGTLILAFLLIHMGDFWFKMKFTPGELSDVSVAGVEGQVKDLFTKVQYSFSQAWIVIVYLIGLIVLSFHLSHGFQSAFQTLGLNHKKYTPFIKALGKGYSILVPLGFAIIPIVYFGDNMGWWDYFKL